MSSLICAHCHQRAPFTALDDGTVECNECGARMSLSELSRAVKTQEVVNADNGD